MLSLSCPHNKIQVYISINMCLIHYKTKIREGEGGDVGGMKTLLAVSVFHSDICPRKDLYFRLARIA